MIPEILDFRMRRKDEMRVIAEKRRIKPIAHCGLSRLGGAPGGPRSKSESYTRQEQDLAERFRARRLEWLPKRSGILREKPFGDYREPLFHAGVCCDEETREYESHSLRGFD